MTFPGHGKLSVSWWTSNPPGTPTGTANVWRGMRFTTSVPGRLAGARVYRASGDTLLKKIEYVGTDPDGKAWADVRRFFAPDSWPAAGWQNVWFHPMRRVAVGVPFIVMAGYQLGQVFQQANAFASGGVTHGHITADKGLTAGNVLEPLDVATLVNTAYGMDILFLED